MEVIYDDSAIMSACSSSDPKKEILCHMVLQIWRDINMLYGYVNHINDFLKQKKIWIWAMGWIFNTKRPSLTLTMIFFH